MKRNPPVWAALAGAWALALALAPTAAAETARAVPGAYSAPDVYGDGILMAFSGLDGKTSWAEPCVASTMGDGLALRFHLSKECVLRIRLPEPGFKALRWRLVSNDLLVAMVPWDAWPLVVGFSSSSVVVGRLPPNARVTLEGGDATIVLLRHEVGDRTQFAVAYDPKGSKAAADAAAQALRVSIDTLVEGRMDFFQKAPRGPRDVEAWRAKTLAKAFSVLKVNVYAPEQPISERWTTPSRWPSRDMFLWDTAFHSLGLMHLDPRLAMDALTAVYRCQADSGMIPQKMAPGQASDISGPCMLGWAAWQIYQWDKMRDRDFLQRSFDTVQKHVTWCLKNRRLDGEPPPTQPLEYGTPLYGWKSAEESGAENSPRFEGGAAFAAIDLSCYLVNECRSLQAMAQALGYGELAKTWGRRAEAIAEAARRELWDAQRGFFFDRKGPGGQWIDVWTSAGLLPLWAGVATADQAQRLRDHLADPRKFWTAMPVPSVARDDPKFKKDMWSGPTWVTMNYLLVRGLQRYGFAREAAELREKTLSSVVAWYGRTGALYEFYDCDGQTPPPELDRKGRLAAHQGTPVISDYNATAALYADLLIRPEP